MRWATLRWGHTTRLAERADDHYRVYDRPSVAELFPTPPAASEVIARILVEEARLAPLTPYVRRVICVGLNYADHVAEMGREAPNFPTLFAKFVSTLTGAFDDVVVPSVSNHVDWEAELAVVIGTRVRRADEATAAAAIAGYTVLNDVSMRDWQNRTLQWLQGKSFENSTPLGPVLATADEVPASARITTSVDDELLQDGRIDDLVFGPAAIVSYISQIFPLDPGDIVATGTPGGVGHARTPPRYLAPGQVVVTAIEGIGSLRNTVVAGA
jgi:acylpyruvate hydrolase